jgi:hypothetical protein
MKISAALLFFTTVLSVTAFASSESLVMATCSLNGNPAVQFNVMKYSNGQYSIEDLGSPSDQGIWIFAANFGCNGNYNFGKCSENEDQIVIKQRWTGGSEPKVIGVFNKQTKQLEITFKQKDFLFYHTMANYQFECN